MHLHLAASEDAAGGPSACGCCVSVPRRRARSPASAAQLLASTRPLPTPGVTSWCCREVFGMSLQHSCSQCLGYDTKGQVCTSGEILWLCAAAMLCNDGRLQCNYLAVQVSFHYIHCWSLIPVSSFPGRPIPPTSSSSLLPSAQLPSSHNPPPVSCQMPLLDSNTSHQIMDTNPDEEFSPNSYLLRACSGPQQASSSGKKIANIRSLFVTCLCRFYAFFCKCVLTSPQNWEHIWKWGKQKSYCFVSRKLLWKHHASYVVFLHFTIESFSVLGAL